MFPDVLNSYLDQEQPLPARVALDTPHMQNTVCEEGRGNIRDTHGSPEETQPHGQFVVLVEVREVQNDLWCNVSCYPFISKRNNKRGALHQG